MRKRLSTYVVLIIIATNLPLLAQQPYHKGVIKGQADSLSVLNSSISFGEGVLLHDLDLQVSAIDSTSVPEMGNGMVNVSVAGEGYRFLPSGIHFNDDGATIRLKYDRTRIPSGYTEDDIHTYFYDIENNKWVALARVDIDKANACVVSKTNHFTDMINGVIIAPESPETNVFTPTMMGDIEAANPASKINLISPPTANNRGSANLEYQFEMPPARNGMQPQVALTYNSDSGSGWAGEGWDIQIPTISVDTRWGVPRYSEQFETETYLLNGQMLAMMDGTEMTVAHRSDSISRQENRQFFLRQGGDFSKIIRIGNSPSNYYWEITDRKGIVYTYGDSNHQNGELRGTIRDLDYNERDVTSEWKLTRMKETHGDSVNYYYSNVEEQVAFGVSAKALYLSSIESFLYNKEASESPANTVITFQIDEKEKIIRQNSARYGFLTSSNKLLKSVDVKFLGANLRTYELLYKLGEFSRERLDTIYHKDNKGNVISYQSFDYYNDVTTVDGVTNAFSSYEEVWGNDIPISTGGIGLIKKNVDKINVHASAIEGTKVKTTEGSLYVGVGPGKESSKTLSGGAQVGYSQSSSSGEVSLLDINGDGLPDKIYKIGSNEYVYCKQYIAEDGNVHFSKPDTILLDDAVSISDFSKSKTSTITGGARFHIGVGPAFAERGFDMMSSTTKTTHYFSDVNNDGLVDIVANGKVFFNTIVDGKSKFVANSVKTPNPIINSGQIEVAELNSLLEPQDTLIKYSPLQDVVRYWEAPFDGTINITSRVRLIVPSQIDEFDSEYSDGVNISVQLGENRELYAKHINKGDTTTYYINQPNVPINRGEKIYFRLRCGDNELCDGNYDCVYWPISIDYSPVDGNQYIDHIDCYGKSILSYSSGDTVYYMGAGQMPIDTTAYVIGNFLKQATIDDITLKVFYESNEEIEFGVIPDELDCVYRRVFPAASNYNGALHFTLPDYCNSGVLTFEISSNSNVNWSDVVWTPQLVMNTTTSSDTINVIPKINCFNKLIKKGSIFPGSNDLNQPCQFVIGSVSNNYLSGKVTAVIKTDDGPIWSRQYEVSNNTIVNDTIFNFNFSNYDKLWVECYTEDEAFACDIDYALMALRKEPPAPDMSVPDVAIEAFVYTISTDESKKTNRGWGQFIYNYRGVDGASFNDLIREDVLCLPQDSINAQPLIMPYNLLSPCSDNPKRLIGAKEDIYIYGDTISTARLGDNCVDPTLIFSYLNDPNLNVINNGKYIGTSAKAPILISKSSSFDTIGSKSVVINVSDNEASGKTITKNAFIDLNGDGYPDIVTPSHIQYTNPKGGFANGGALDRINLGLSGNEKDLKSESYSSSIGIGGDPIHAYNICKKQGLSANAEANSKNGAMVSWSGSKIEDSVIFGNYSVI